MYDFILVICSDHPLCTGHFQDINTCLAQWHCMVVQLMTLQITKKMMVS